MRSYDQVGRSVYFCDVTIQKLATDLRIKIIQWNSYHSIHVRLIIELAVVIISVGSLVHFLTICTSTCTSFLHQLINQTGKKHGRRGSSTPPPNKDAWLCLLGLGGQHLSFRSNLPPHIYRLYFRAYQLISFSNLKSTMKIGFFEVN